ncbi:DUF924 family protein [Neotabrizicola sp. VNH66]|uniref:DUF924 family protein n=1 Tax=Neotabrizicola sp. VNH66 TaxID=3400918 RepID=UPI003C059687
MTDNTDAGEIRAVLDFWFPEGRALDIDPDRHAELWRWRMHGSADSAIAARFGPLTERGAAGALDHWAEAPEGRLALIVVLDQFPRSLWRGSKRAWAQDPAALAQALEGLENGDWAALGLPWFQIAFTQPLGHAEGPDHLTRIDRLIALRRDIAARVPAPLRPLYASLVDQAGKVRRVIASFGRHPHRNAILGRNSTPEEEAYLEKGDFPHQRAFRG